MKTLGLLLLIFITFAPFVTANGGELDEAVKLFIEKKYDVAYPLLEKLFTENADDVRVYLYKGIIERSRRDYLRAIKTFRRGIEKNPSNIYLLLELAVTYSWNSDLTQALKIYNRALEIEPANITAALGKARVLSWLARFREATAIYNEILKFDNPKFRNEALNGIAFIERVKLQKKRAAANYKEVLAADAQNVEAREGLAALEHDTRREINFSYGTTTNSATNRANDISFNFSAQITRKAGIFLSYHNQNADRYLESLILNSNNPTNKATESFIFGVKYKFSERLKTSASYIERRLPRQTDRYFSVEGAYRLNKKYDLLFGQTTLFTTRNKPLEILTFAGLNRKFERDNLSFQYFNTGRLQAGRTNAIVLNWTHKLDQKTNFTIGSGIGKTKTSIFETAFIEFNRQIRYNLDFSVRYTIFHSNFTQNGLIISTRYRF